MPFGPFALLRELDRSHVPFVHVGFSGAGLAFPALLGSRGLAGVCSALPSAAFMRRSITSGVSVSVSAIFISDEAIAL